MYGATDGATDGGAAARRPAGAEANADAVRALLREVGFERVGFADAGPAPHADRLDAWLAAGHHGDMEYLARSVAKRRDPGRVLAGTRSVIALAVFYRDAAPAALGAAAGGAAISAYARSEDYHRVLERRLRRATARLTERFPESAFRWYVDTGPVLERAWAERAGLGWIGKNCCAIDPDRGSYFFIAVILSTLALPADPPATDHCGACRLCLDACPTNAFLGPRELDARRCISYQTIENRGPVPEALRPAMGAHVFGCDICQDVCPFNRPRPPGAEAVDAELAPRRRDEAANLAELLDLDEAGFRERFPRSAVRRARAAGLARNSAIAAGNSGRSDLVPHLEALAERHAADAVVVEAAAWARARIEEQQREATPKKNPPSA